MTFEQITNPKKEVRVLRNTRFPNKQKEDLIGKIVEVRSEDYYDNTIDLWNEDKSRGFYFNRSDVQFLVPEVMYEGARIAVGDEVNDGIVYGYHWYDGAWRVQVVRNNDFSHSCNWFRESQIISHTPLYKETKTFTRKEIADKFGIPLEELKIEE